MVNVLYNEHTMTDAEEKENYLAFLKESVALDRALLALRTIEEKEAIDVVEAEIRCMEESGDINTLENYYREAADEASDKKEGIISKVWEFIKDMLIKIKDFLVLKTFSKLSALEIQYAIPPHLFYFCKELIRLSDFCVLQAGDCR